MSDETKSLALIKALEIIGEAVKKVPLAVRKKYPVIPWKEMAGMRDVMVHAYYKIRLETVWKVATKRIPELAPEFEKVLNDCDRELFDSLEKRDEA